MRNQIIVLVASGLVATSGFTGTADAAQRGERRHERETSALRADGDSGRSGREEGIGLGSGAAIGGLAGGPVGLILGAAFGGWLGDRFHHERSERLAAEQRAGAAEAETAVVARNLAATERAMAALQSELDGERFAHRRDLSESLALEVYFRTEQSAVDPETGARLAQLAGLVMPLGDAVIRLEGHTDARGTERFNDRLAAERAAAVRDALIAGGLPAERIVVTASGETGATAAEQDVDGMALERRVTMRIVDLGEAGQVAHETP